MWPQPFWLIVNSKQRRQKMSYSSSQSNQKSGAAGLRANETVSKKLTTREWAALPIWAGAPSRAAVIVSILSLEKTVNYCNQKRKECATPTAPIRKAERLLVTFSQKLSVPSPRSPACASTIYTYVHKRCHHAQKNFNHTILNKVPACWGTKKGSNSIRLF